MNAQKDELDRWLDGALAEYKAPEPRPGLELRTVAYVRSQPAPRRWAWWGKWALAAAAVVVIAAALAWRTKTIAPNQQVRAVPPAAQTTVTASAQPPVSVARVRFARTHKAPARIVAMTAAITAEPKLAVFPAPLPLTAEERMLLTMTRRSPQALTVLAHNDEPIAPIVIEEIRIRGLESAEPISNGGKK